MPKPLAELAQNARTELGKAIVGHGDALDTLFLTLVCGGHALVEGVPGLGKTLAVRTLARILSVRFRRVQCTPDLMPADIIGSNVFSVATSQFTLHEGPVFTDLRSWTKSTACRRGRSRA
jgi:MoxR-like ATPase